MTSTIFLIKFLAHEGMGNVFHFLFTLSPWHIVDVQ